MIRTLKLGFHSSLISRKLSVAVISRKQRIDGLFFATSRVTMRSERLLSTSTSAEKLKESVSLEPSNKQGFDTQGSPMEEAEIGGEMEKMTLQQLRTKLRSTGDTAKGNKQELPSSLESCQDMTADDNNILTEELTISSEVGPTLKWKRLKRRSKRSADIDQKIVNSVSELTQSSSRIMEGPDMGKIAARATQKRKQDRSFTSSERAGKMSVKAKGKVSAVIAPSELRMSEVDEPWTVFAHKRPQPGWIAYNPKTMRPPPLGRDINSLKLVSWNVNGLRGLLRGKSLSVQELAERENFDILCLQETKLQEKDVEVIKESLIDGYKDSFWTCSVGKLGYSGTAIISRIKPISVQYGMGISDHDSEGRLVTAEFDDFYLSSVYVPNSSEGLKRLPYRITHWDPSLGKFIKELEKSKPVILTGDFNCAHEEIDIFNPQGNRRSAGFTDEERQSFQENFLNQGFVDTFRRQHPGVVGYTYWGYRYGGRKTNKGWRLDYFLVSEHILDKVHDSYILPDIVGSDHSPIGLIVKF